METSRSYNDNLPADHQGINDEDPQLEVFNQYGNHIFEDYESFCDRMRETHGRDWVYKFIRK